MLKIEGPIFGLNVFRNDKKAEADQVDHPIGRVEEIKISNYELVDQAHANAA